MPAARSSTCCGSDFVSRDGYLIVLIMVLLTVVMIADRRRLHAAARWCRR